MEVSTNFRPSFEITWGFNPSSATHSKPRPGLISVSCVWAFGERGELLFHANLPFRPDALMSPDASRRANMERGPGIITNYLNLR